MLSETGRSVEAVAMLRKLLAIRKRTRTDSTDVAETMHELAVALLRLDKYEEALEELDVAHAILLLLTKGQHYRFKQIVELQAACRDVIAHKSNKK